MSVVGNPITLGGSSSGAVDLLPYTYSLSFRDADFITGGIENVVIYAPRISMPTYFLWGAQAKSIEVTTSTGQKEYFCGRSNDQTLERITLHTDNGTITGWGRGMLAGRKALKGLYGVKINMNSTNNANMFQSCNALEDIQCVENTANNSFSLAWSYKLSDDSIISVANSLKEDVTGQTITLSSDTKTKCNSILGDVQLDSTETYHIFSANVSGTVTLTNFITSTKGWTIA